MKYKAFQFRLSTAALVTVTGFVVLCTLTAFAQSGRRAKKSTPLPPVQTPEASPTPTPSKSPEQTAIPIMLGANSLDAFGNIPSYFRETVARSCGDRLRQRAFHVDLTPRELTGSEAVKRAKAAKEGYVVLLELRSDRMGSDRNASELSIIYINYTVYAAVTGKQVTSGNVYQQAGLRDIIGGRGDSIGITEQRLKNAAQMAADRIFSAVLKRQP
jgi:hypothetical protein